MKNIYLIKDLARISGYSVHTLKYYLNMGLVEEIGRSPRTNYRFFDDSTLERLSAIREMRREGMSIARIQECYVKPGE